MRNTATEVTERKDLRQLIDERGLRYQFVAEKAAVTPSHLSKVMAGERPLSEGLAERLAEVLGVPLAELMGGGQ